MDLADLECFGVVRSDFASPLERACAAFSIEAPDLRREAVRRVLSECKWSFDLHKLDELPAEWELRIGKDVAADQDSADLKALFVATARPLAWFCLPAWEAHARVHAPDRVHVLREALSGRLSRFAALPFGDVAAGWAIFWAFEVEEGAVQPALWSVQEAARDPERLADWTVLALLYLLDCPLSEEHAQCAAAEQAYL